MGLFFSTQLKWECQKTLVEAQNFDFFHKLWGRLIFWDQRWPPIFLTSNESSKSLVSREYEKPLGPTVYKKLFRFFSKKPRFCDFCIFHFGWTFDLKGEVAENCVLKGICCRCNSLSNGIKYVELGCSCQKLCWKKEAELGVQREIKKIWAGLSFSSITPRKVSRSKNKVSRCSSLGFLRRSM